MTNSRNEMRLDLEGENIVVASIKEACGYVEHFLVDGVAELHGAGWRKELGWDDSGKVKVLDTLPPRGCVRGR